MRRVGLIDAQDGQAVKKPVCPHCGKEYRTDAGLHAHVKKEHPQVFDEEEAECR